MDGRDAPSRPGRKAMVNAHPAAADHHRAVGMDRPGQITQLAERRPAPAGAKALRFPGLEGAFHHFGGVTREVGSCRRTCRTESPSPPAGRAAA